MTTPTITLDSAGAVPALPENLHAVALAARDIPARTWGVVACPDDGAPVLQIGGLPNSVAAGRRAHALTIAYGPALFVVYRCPNAVTVHGVHPEHAHNLFGTLPMTAAQTRPAPDKAALVAHVSELAADLHEYALATHRREQTHHVIDPDRPF
jgi:hypothetical protein